MTINIDTGSVQVSYKVSRGYGANFIGHVTEYNDTTPSEMVVYPTADRRVLLVEPNSMLVLTGYNLYGDTRVSFRKVLRSNGIPAHGSNGCCPIITVANTIRLYSAELPCWVMDRCNPVFVIKTPGSYEVDVVGDGADVVITAMPYPLQDTNLFGGCACPSVEPPSIVEDPEAS